MILEYLPTNKINIDGVLIEFGNPRSVIRNKLGGAYKEDNSAVLIGTSESELIHQRRDIYANFNNSQSFFFLGYDIDDLLSEVEVHYCDKVKIFDFLFDFNTPIELIASRLERFSDITKQNSGEYFFRDLKLNIMDKFRMGSKGYTLGYFYCASDVSHLEE